MNSAVQITLVLLAIALAVALIGLGPLATIWSLNTLFGLNIAYNFWTWLSVVWFNLLAYGISTNGARLLKKH